MKIEYKFNNGEHSEVEVSEELGAIILDMQREEENNGRRYRRHNYSLEREMEDGFSHDVYEEDYSALSWDMEEIESVLTETEQRRFRMLAAEYSIQEIATAEGTSKGAMYCSIQRIRKKVSKILKKDEKQG